MLKPGWFVVALCFVAVQAHAGVTVLLEEPYGYDGAFAGTGHTAVYLSHVCAATPTFLRHCEPGELGTVISRYNRIGGYDWIAIPLIPYLYAVAKPEEIPLYADSKLVALLRDRYRREHLEGLAPDTTSGEVPVGDWVQLIGSSYDRTSYGFQLETTPEQDDRLIRWLNDRPNRKSYRVVYRNCADFVREIVNFYYPRAVSRGFFLDLDVATPKRAATSFIKYSERHRGLEFSSFVIPQVPGDIRRSRPIRGVVESIFRAKKYVIPLAVLHPFLAGGFASVVFIGGRFDPAKNALIFNPEGEFEQPLSAEERGRYLSDLDDLARAFPEDSASQGGPGWRQFQQTSKAGIDSSGLAILTSKIGDNWVSLGISRTNLFTDGSPSHLQYQFLVSRLRFELAGGRFPRTSNTEVRDDWELLQKAVTARYEGNADHAVIANGTAQRAPGNSFAKVNP